MLLQFGSFHFGRLRLLYVGRFASRGESLASALELSPGHSSSAAGGSKDFRARRTWCGYRRTSCHGIGWIGSILVICTVKAVPVLATFLFDQCLAAGIVGFDDIEIVRLADTDEVRAFLLGIHQANLDRPALLLLDRKELQGGDPLWRRLRSGRYHRHGRTFLRWWLWPLQLAERLTLQDDAVMVERLPRGPRTISCRAGSRALPHLEDSFLQSSFQPHHTT